MPTKICIKLLAKTRYHLDMRIKYLIYRGLKLKGGCYI